MSREAIRVSVVTAVEAAKTLFTAYPLVIEYDNKILVDTKTQTNPFLRVGVKYLTGEQADLSNTPIHRIWGQIYISAAVPEGSGSSKANQLLDFFTPKLHLKNFGAVRTMAATVAADKPHLGWLYTTIAIPFWADQPST